MSDSLAFETEVYWPCSAVSRWARYQSNLLDYDGGIYFLCTLVRDLFSFTLPRDQNMSVYLSEDLFFFAIRPIALQCGFRTKSPATGNFISFYLRPYRERPNSGRISPEALYRRNFGRWNSQCSLSDNARRSVWCPRTVCSQGALANNSWERREARDSGSFVATPQVGWIDGVFRGRFRLPARKEASVCIRMDAENFWICILNSVDMESICETYSAPPLSEQGNTAGRASKVNIEGETGFWLKGRDHKTHQNNSPSV